MISNLRKSWYQSVTYVVHSCQESLDDMNEMHNFDYNIYVSDFSRF